MGPLWWLAAVVSLTTVHRALALTVLFLTLASCTSEVAVDEAEILRRLGIAEPGPVAWTDEIDGIPIVGIDVPMDRNELEVLRQAWLEVPERLQDRAEVRQFVRTRRLVEDNHVRPEALAFARGPDIWLVDASFDTTDLVELATILAHELAHVAQFRSIDSDTLDAMEQHEAGLDLNSVPLVVEFANSIGWQRQTTADGTVWVLSAGAGSTAYGLTDPAEDMAESVARTLDGRTTDITSTRVEWVADWLDTSVSDLVAGKPWFPFGTVAVSSDQPLYSVSLAPTPAPGSDPIYRAASASSPMASLSLETEANLSARGFTGDIAPVAASGPERHAGLMTSGVRTFWVELVDLRADPRVNGVVWIYLEV